MFNLQNAIIPKPRHTEDRKRRVKIGCLTSADVSVLANGSGEVFSQAVSYLKSGLCEKLAADSLEGKYNIIICQNNKDPRFGVDATSEAYIINIESNRAELIGFGEAGAYYAAVSFVCLVHSVGCDVFVPECYIYDYPYFKKRGHFMECRYGSDFMTLDNWREAIDYLSKMKINNITLGLYGCWPRQYDGEFAEYQYIPFRKYPELKTLRNIKYYSAKEKRVIYKKDVLPVIYEEDYFGEMISYGKSRNVEVMPLFNSYGHNTLIPRLFPEISAVDESGKLSGVGLCTNNEKTYEILFDIYDEIIDRYLTPHGIKGFEVGFDEVWPVLGFDISEPQKSSSPFCSCDKCKSKPYTELMVEYLIRLAKYLKKKGMKDVYVYYDMLFEAGLLNENLVQRFKDEDIYDVIVIDWWAYAKRSNIYRERREQVNGLFRSIGKPITGYFHWNMPTQEHEDVYAVTEVAMEHGFEGLVGYSSFEYCYDYNYRVFAECAWNPEEGTKDGSTLIRYVSSVFPQNITGAYNAIVRAERFMGGRHVNDNYCETLFDYYMSSYLRKDLPYPQDYPSKQFRAIKEDEDKYLEYLRLVNQEADFVYRYFDENTSSRAGDIWKLNALTYKVLADEFLTVYTCAAQYAQQAIDGYEFSDELERLVKEREKLISLCEDVRIKANQYTLLRNMSIIKQFVCDLLSYIKKELSAGKQPEIDIFNFKNYLSEFSVFLR